MKTWWVRAENEKVLLTADGRVHFVATSSSGVDFGIEGQTETARAIPDTTNIPELLEGFRDALRRGAPSALVSGSNALIERMTTGTASQRVVAMRELTDLTERDEEQREGLYRPLLTTGAAAVAKTLLLSAPDCVGDTETESSCEQAPERE